MLKLALRNIKQDSPAKPKPVRLIVTPGAALPVLSLNNRRAWFVARVNAQLKNLSILRPFLRHCGFGVKTKNHDGALLLLCVGSVLSKINRIVTKYQLRSIVLLCKFSSNFMLILLVNVTIT